jgi:O-methyltransferase
LEEVKQNVRDYGEIGVCKFIKGWFSETMPSFSAPIAIIYLDVDLAASTRTCLKYLYPKLVHGGVLYSHDGHIPLVVEVFDDDAFWNEELGCTKPVIEGLYRQKLIKIIKPASL